MMIHFVYPNVNNEEFIGCGRYAVLTSPNEEYELAKPETINRAAVITAASMLAPEFDVMKNDIYEKKDIPTETYIGESLDLAYLLVLISGFRKVKLDIEHDIWCTGSIDAVGDKIPFLSAVEGFDIKLHKFLSEENRDTLFIVPEANIQPHIQLLRETNINVVSLSQFQNLASQEISERKTIVIVRRDELKELIGALFKPALGKSPPGFVRTWQYQVGDKVGSVAIGADGKTIVAGTIGRKVFCLDGEGHLRWQINVEKDIWCITLSPDGQTAVVGTWNRFPLDDKKLSLFCFDEKGSQLWQDTSTSSVWALACSADGQTIAAGISDELVLFDIEGKRSSLQNNKGIIWLLNTWTMAVALSATGEIIAAGTGSEKCLRIFKQNGAMLGEYRTQGDLYTVAVSTNGEFVATGDTEGYIYWLNQQGELLWKEQLADKIQAVALDSGAQQLWVGTGKKDGHLRVYDSMGRLVWRHHVGGSVRSLALSENGQRAVVGTEESGIYIFNRDGTVLHQASAGKAVRSIAVSATGERIVAGSLDGVIYGFQLQQ